MPVLCTSCFWFGSSFWTGTRSRLSCTGWTQTCDMPQGKLTSWWGWFWCSCTTLCTCLIFMMTSFWNIVFFYSTFFSFFLTLRGICCKLLGDNTGADPEPLWHLCFWPFCWLGHEGAAHSQLWPLLDYQHHLGTHWGNAHVLNTPSDSI